MGADISELRTLAADLTAAGASVGSRARDVVRKTAYDIERDAKALVAVDTGNLKNSIGHSDLRLGTSGQLAVEIGPTANYGIFLELGTSRMPAQPFMGPAADRNEPGFEAAMGQLAGDILDG